MADASGVSPPATPVPTLLRPGTRFDGLVALDLPARIDGLVRGRILARGLLWLGPEARVQGDVRADELVVEGRLEGRVRARTRAELRPSARVRAEMVTPRLHLEEGCVLEGRCRTRPEDLRGAAAEPGEAPESAPGSP